MVGTFSLLASVLPYLRASVGAPRVELGLPAPKAGVLPSYAAPYPFTLRTFSFTINLNRPP